MRNFILVVSALINIVFLIISLFYLTDINLKTILLIIFSIANLLCVYNIYSNKSLKISFLFLTINYFLQSFSFILFGIAYKFLIGPNFYLYSFKENGDTFLKSSFHLFETNFYVTLDSSSDFLIGINIFHFILFIALIKVYKTENKK